MGNSTIDHDHLDYIIDQIHEGSCVPFLGAGANANCEKHNYKGLPLGADIAEKFVEKINFEGRDSRDLARVSLQFEFRLTRLYLIRTLKTLLPDQQCLPSPLLKVIAKLPFELIVTTNYDRLMEQALKEVRKKEGVDFECVIQPTEGFGESAEIQNWLNDLFLSYKLILYKIHGTFYGAAPPEPRRSDGPKSSIVTITEDDYIKFISLINDEKIGIPKPILSRIKNSALLFLGYSLEDWDIRTIFEIFINPIPKGLRRMSFAIQKDAPKFWIEFWRKKEVEIYNMDLYDFAELLDIEYQKKYGNISVTV